MCLLLTCILSIVIRLFSVVRYESIIHEFDPYFNYRSTEYLSANGPYEFINYFDSNSWYPLGRSVGPTIYPGLMMTTSLLQKFAVLIGLPISVKNVCVFVSPLFSALTVIASYLITEELGLPGSGLFASLIIAIVPAYISRSVAGSFDNEGIAIFAMIFTYYLWTRAVRTGSILNAVLAAIAYFYMVSAWGGYVFIINLIPIHVLVVLFSEGLTPKLYVAYSVFYCTGTLLSMQIPFVGFQPVQSSEHIGALGIFGILQLIGVYSYLRESIGRENVYILAKKILGFVFCTVVLYVITLVSFGYVSPWTGRFYSLLDPSYAKNHIPIIASVAEHQATSWCSFYNDFFTSLYCLPLGIYYCIYSESLRTKHARIFVLTYVMISLYFSSLMVRLILVLAPGVSILAGVGLSKFCQSVFFNPNSKMTLYSRSNVVARSSLFSATIHHSRTPKAETAYSKFQHVMLIGMIILVLSFCRHCIMVSNLVYSNPSIILTSQSRLGQRIILDDFRESYWWLRQNTPEDAKIMSWWDYGYQISSLANRTTIVDNNTWNNTHISRVGQAMVKPEDQSVPIMRELDVDYILVLFGGLIGFSGDDISKSIWMIRIGASTEHGLSINEPDYFAANGDFRINEEAGDAFKNSLLYRMCFYQFDKVSFGMHIPSGYDRVRNEAVGVKNISFDMIEEVFTSENWIVRIFKLKKDSNLDNNKGQFVN
ncbi:hypothetical protein GJ496_010107 [Pomphorhynchus laevis]|nr:hypothetical protein GJ496_010107 [Pomphorhynchus laevis]